MESKTLRRRLEGGTGQPGDINPPDRATCVPDGEPKPCITGKHTTLSVHGIRMQGPRTQPGGTSGVILLGSFNQCGFCCGLELWSPHPVVLRPRSRTVGLLAELHFLGLKWSLSNVPGSLLLNTRARDGQWLIVLYTWSFWAI